MIQLMVRFTNWWMDKVIQIGVWLYTKVEEAETKEYNRKRE